MTNLRRDEPARPPADIELAKNDGDTKKSQPAERRRQPVFQPSLADDPRLHATLEQVDLALKTTTPESYLAPPPLTARLVVPLSYGRWSPILHAESAPSFDADPISEAHLSEIDGELMAGPAELDSFATPPPLMARLPGPTHASDRRKRGRPSPVRSVSAPVNQWIVSVTLILLMFAGAAAGALVFHERLSAIVLRWDLRLK